MMYGTAIELLLIRARDAAPWPVYALTA